MGAMSKSSSAEPTAARVDVWLWAARFFKTRSLAKQAIDGGHVDVNGAGCKPARTLHAGDRLMISRGEERLEVDVLMLSGRRGPASVVQALYRETEPSRVAREAARELHRLIGASGPPKRPDKQARRDLRRLKHDR